MMMSPKTRAGFTLLELMVALSIYIIMALLLLANQDKFNDSVSLSDLAYDVALSIRQAQTYGYAVTNQGQPTNITGTSPFFNYFGVHFDLSKGNATSFLVFSEPISCNTGCGGLGGAIPYNKLNTVQSVVSSYTLQNGYSISAVCAKNSSSSSFTCQSAGSSAAPNSAALMDVIFQRPRTNAIICLNPTFGGTGIGVDCATNNTMIQAQIVILSPTGDSEYVDVYSTGDIEVDTPST